MLPNWIRNGSLPHGGPDSQVPTRHHPVHRSWKSDMEVFATILIDARTILSAGRGELRTDRWEKIDRDIAWHP